MIIYRLSTKYITAGGGLIKFDLSESSKYLTGLWWSGEEVHVNECPTATYRYSKTPPIAVSTGSLIQLFRPDAVQLITSLENEVQVVDFLILGKANIRYGYCRIKTLHHLDIFDETLSKFGTDGIIKTLSIKSDIPLDRHFFRIRGLEDVLFISSKLADGIEQLNDGSLEIQKVILRY